MTSSEAELDLKSIVIITIILRILKFIFVCMIISSKYIHFGNSFDRDTLSLEIIVFMFFVNRTF